MRDESVGQGWRRLSADTGALADSQGASGCLGYEVATVFAKIKNKGRR
jgi:hypothetical protein